MSITPIGPIQWPVGPDPLRQVGSTPNAAFGELLNSAVNTVQTSATDASKSVERFLSGEGEELHNVVLAQQRASLTFDMFLQVRNKVVSAYQEVMRMPL